MIAAKEVEGIEPILNLQGSRQMRTWAVAALAAPGNLGRRRGGTGDPLYRFHGDAYPPGRLSRMGRQYPLAALVCPGHLSF